jgi:hypothetical protein|tara:strand:- start:2893 stop:3336 length:444 start_codon:yes stop_codon:yes gene_type:complete
MPKGKFRQGVFTPRNRDKYRGKTLPIYRSGWELKFFRWCDLNENVTAWDSECVIIPYLNPLTKKVQRYFVDGLVTINETNGPKTYLIEIKPSKQTQPPKSKKYQKKATTIYEQKTYVQNRAKWDAAEKWAKKKGVEFKILTEKELGI